ncbi:STAS-like domain-containing protein [Chitinophaga filiformis]|uniref:STAS-like domain-containing protein n=1 Tax=Chitinophaga filiformis TaxID=104663 RepID=UPI001F1CB6E8|nr:DUF4325 domain-containing protein [Chitinophaga filiformis]MCF6407430.1 STAS-like domain-containing protein [Chitinophaga filiformis]
MKVTQSIDIAKEFSSKPGARYKYEGDFSGQLFLESLLLPKFDKAVQEGGKVLIILDDVLGYPSSFISGSFGKLSIDKGADQVLKHLEFESKNQMRIDKIISEIQNPKKK